MVATAYEADKLANGGATIVGLRFNIERDQITSTIEAKMPKIEFIRLVFELGSASAEE